MVREQEYCKRTTSYRRNGKGKSTFLVLDGDSFAPRPQKFFNAAGLSLRCCGECLCLSSVAAMVAPRDGCSSCARHKSFPHRCGSVSARCVSVSRLLSLRCCRYRFFAAQRAHGKKFIAAWFATQRGKSQQPPKERHHARHELRRNALQFEIAANPAMRINNVAER